MTNNQCFGRDFDEIDDCEDCKVRMSCYKKYIKKGRVNSSEIKRPSRIYKPDIKRGVWICDKIN